MVALLNTLTNTPLAYQKLLKEAGYKYLEDTGKDLTSLSKHEATGIISFLVDRKNQLGIRRLSSKGYSDFDDESDDDAYLWECSHF